MTDEQKELTHSNAKWYAVQTLSNQEAKVQKTIENCAAASGVKDYIKRVLFPTESVSEVKNGRKYVRVKKLYPGYLFLEIELYHEDGKLNQNLWMFIRNINGVSNFVGGERPVALRQSEIDEILYQVEAKAGQVKPKMTFDVGTMVKITDGPFAGSTGEVESVDPENGKLRVSVGLFGRFTPVDLEFWQVVKEEL